MDEFDAIYREAVPPGQKSAKTPPRPAPTDAAWQETITLTSPLVFRYSAVTWNAHRIHYDEPYTTGVEGHPGVVIDGPLQGDWLTQVVLDWLADDGELVEFEYSNRKASYLGQTLTAGGTIEQVDTNTGEVRVTLFITDENGDITTPGSATVHLTPAAQSR